MPSSESERVTCPKCGKGYRWQPALVGKSVPCKQCGSEFEIPNKPGMGVLPQPADDGLYELAADPDDEPELPPAFALAKTPPAEAPTASPVEPAVHPTHDPEPAETASDTPDRDEDSPSEPQVHLSEAAKAARREAQRVAAAENEPQPKWWQQKWLIIAAALLVLFVIIYWAIYAFSEAMEDGLHNTMQQHRAEFFVASEPTHSRNKL